MKLTIRKIVMKILFFIYLITALLLCAIYFTSCTAQAIQPREFSDKLIEFSNSSKTSISRIYKDSKGNKYIIYESVKGKLFIYKVSKTGKPYKMYIKSSIYAHI